MQARAQLARFIAKFSPEVAARARAILARMRARLPGAVELVYDNYNALAIGFGPSGRAPRLQSSAGVRICLFSYSAGVSPTSELCGRRSL